MGNKNKIHSAAHHKSPGKRGTSGYAKDTPHKQPSHPGARKHKRATTTAHDKHELDIKDDDQTQTHEGHEHELDAPQTPDESLRYIYDMDAEDDKKVDMSKLEIMKAPVVRRILVSTLLVLIAIAAGLAGTLILNNPLSNGNEDALTFDISTDEDGVVSGRLTEILIPYHNPGKVPLADVEMVLQIPDSFIVESTIPEAVSTNPLTWKVGSLSPKERGEIKIEGTFYETPGTAVTVQTISRYVPANFSSPFEDIETASVLIEESIFTTAINGPARAVPGEMQEYTVTVEHSEKDRIIDNVELRLDLPTGFTIESSTIEPTQEGQAIWKMQIEPEVVTQMKVRGTFASDVQGDQEIASVVGVNMRDKFVEQARATSTTSVLASDFSISLIANGQTGDSIVLPGDDITVNITLDNRGEEAGENITIELFVDDGMDRVDLAGRSGIPNGDVYGNKINWDGSDLNRLETLRGSENASIDISIPTRDSGGTTVVLRAEATITSVGDLEINRTIESSTITIRIASDIQASSSAYYYGPTGAVAGSGPLPPEVGEETTYRVTWTVVNALNDVEDLVMVAPIPSDAVWGGLVSSSDGSVHFDGVANRVRWSVGDLLAGASPPIAVFDIKSTPTSADIGTFLDLLGPATVTAFDTSTNAQVSTGAPAITSELPNDPLAENKGIVVE